MNLRRALTAGLDQMLPDWRHGSETDSDELQPPHESENAFDFFQAAAGRLAQAEIVDDMTADPPSRVYGGAEKIEVLRANAPVFPLVQRGLEMRYAAPPFHPDTPPKFYLRQFGILASLLTLHADVRLDQGDAVGAMDRCLDTIRLGQKIEGGGAPLVARFVSTACQAVAQRRMWKIIDLLPNDSVYDVMHRLQKIREGQLSFSNCLHAERAIGREMIERTFDLYPTLTGSLRQYGDKQHALDAYNRYIETLIRRSRRRYGVSERTDAPAPPPNPLQGQAGFALRRTRFVVANVEQTQNALLLTALALRAYRAEHGKYPDALDALCPHYLGTIPGDEFAEQGSLRYRLTNAANANVSANAYVLYSVGPDGMDDDGKPIDNPAAPAGWRHLVQPDSVGDIVAGVNF